MPEYTLRRIRGLSPPVYAHLQDWVVLEDGEVIGRIYEEREKRPGLEWSWSITSLHNHNGRHTVKTSAYAATLEDAKRDFLKNWEKLKKWRQPPR